MIGNLTGIKMIENKNLVEFETVNRTWKERLFTLPWRPFLKIKTISKPSKQIYWMSQYSTIMFHPIMKQEIMRLISEANA